MTSPLSKEQLELANEAVDNAVKRETFSMLDFISNGGVVMPSKKLDIFTDVEANFEIDEIDAELDRLYKLAKMQKRLVGPDPAVTGPLEARKAELAERNEQSHIVVHLRGVHPTVDDELRRELQKRNKKTPFEDNAWTEAYNCGLVAKAITQVEKNGQVDNHIWTAEEAGTLISALPPTEAHKLITTATYLTSGVRMADRRVDAGFPGGRADMAGEPTAVFGAEDGDSLG